MHVEIGQAAPAVAAGVAGIAAAILIWRARAFPSISWLVICLVLPALAAIFALLAAADICLSATGTTSRIVILLDESASVRRSPWRDPQWVRRLAAARLGDSAQVTVVGFDAAPHLLLSDIGVTADDAPRWPSAWPGFAAVPTSCLAAATQWRADRSDHRPRWLITDGLLEMDGAGPVAGVTLLPPATIDVAISDLRAAAGELRARVTASEKIAGMRLTLLRDGMPVGGTDLDLDAGAARWIGTPVPPGSANFEARVSLPGSPDAWPEDDIARLWHTEAGPPRVLTLRKGASLPRDPWALAAAGWQVIALHDVAAQDLSSEQWQTLDGFVRETGGGLVFSGAADFGPGDYAHNALAEALPPVSSVQTDGPAARIAFVIDASASMNGDDGAGQQREAVALQGVFAALPMLQSRDRVALITFNDAARIVGAGPRDQLIAGGIPRIDPLGGTHPDTAFPLLRAGLGAADGPAAVILLTDGQVPSTDATAWKRTLAELGAKLAIIAPPDARSGALADLLAQTGGVWLDGTAAQWGHSLAAAVEATGVLRAGAVRPGGTGDDGTPVGPFAETWPRPQGRVLHTVTDSDGRRWPLEAVAQRGLGRVVGYTGESSPIVAQRLVQEAAATDGDRRFSLRAQRIGDEWHVIADGAEGNSFVNGAKLDLQSASGVQAFRQIAPGRYEATVADPRAALVTETVGEEERLVGRVEAPEIGAGHPAEWPALAAAASHLAGAQDVPGDPDAEGIWRAHGEAWRWILWPWLSGAAAALGMASLGARRRVGIGVRAARS